MRGAVASLSLALLLALATYGCGGSSLTATPGSGGMPPARLEPVARQAPAASRARRALVAARGAAAASAGSGGGSAGAAGTGGGGGSAGHGGASGSGGGAGASGASGASGGGGSGMAGASAAGAGGRGGAAGGGAGPSGVYVPPPATRTDTLIDTGWKHLRMDDGGASATAYNDAAWASVTLPHTWNAIDGQDGGNDYYRGIGWYRRHYTPPASAAGGAIVPAVRRRQHRGRRLRQRHDGRRAPGRLRRASASTSPTCSTRRGQRHRRARSTTARSPTWRRCPPTSPSSAASTATCTSSR